MNSNAPAPGGARPTADRVLLALVLAARLALGLAYTVSVPIWEADNEDGHFAYARYIAKHGRLLQPGDPEAEAIFQKFQPPLYYALTAIVLAGFDLGAAFPAPERNPFIQDGMGANYALHPKQLTPAEAALWNAVHAARALGVVISTLAVAVVQRAFRRLWPGRPGRAWAATLLVAFWPQFLFTGSMVTNDVLVTALGLVVFYLAVRLMQAGFRLRLALLLGLALGAAILSKINALGLVPMAGLALLLSWRAAPRGAARPAGRRRIGAAVLGLAAVTVGAVGILSSLTFVTAQVFQARTFQDFVLLAPGLGSGGQASIAIEAPRFVFRTFLASYGWGNLETDPWVYDVWLIAALAGLAGLSVWLVRRPGWAAFKPVALAGTALLSLIGLAVALAISQQNVYVPGRYLLLILPSVAVLLLTGWEALTPARWRRHAWKAPALALILLGWVIPFYTLMPVYAPPQPVDPERAPAVDRSVAADFGDALRLWGFIPAEATTPGGLLRATLCWEARAPVPAHYPLLLEIVGPDGQGYGRRLAYPGNGNYPTRFWIVGEPFCDWYEVPVGANYPAPSVGALRVVFQEQAFGTALPVRALDGADLGGDARVPIVVRDPAPPAAPQHATAYRFDDAITLSGYDLTPLADGRPGWVVTLHWRTSAALPEAYKVFVHLRDTPTSAFAQSDHPPRDGAYPTTAWAPGETVLDTHTLVLPDEAAPPLTLVVGVYRAADGTRLAVTDSAGAAIPNGEVTLPFP